ncbi:hypothetical protein ABFX02_05G100700 [Erythranthe guttata]
MVNRRFAQAPTSDDEDDSPPPLPPPRRSPTRDGNLGKRKRKLVRFSDEDEDEKDIVEAKVTEQKNKKNKKNKKSSEESDPESGSENEEQEDTPAQPLGSVIRVSGKGRGRKNHYESFEYNGNQYSLEDPAFFQPENENQKPYVAIIKDIAQNGRGELVITGQWFYRPEEAVKKGGGNWELIDTRELFYSFHRDEIAAESIFHKCVVHFIPLHKQIPARQQHPGFFVQKVYDTEQRKLFKLTDKDYEESKQHEIDVLVQKTLARLGDIPDLVPEHADVDNEDQLKNKKSLRRTNIAHLDVSKEEDVRGLGKSQLLKLDTPRKNTSLLEYYAVLSKFDLLTGETKRDKWLDKLLESIHFICTPLGSKQTEGEKRDSPDIKSPGTKGDRPNSGSLDKTPNVNDLESFVWPDGALSAIAALEKAAYDGLSADFHKYHQKLRQLSFNLKSNAALTRRLLNGELEPAQVLNMSPAELKEGLTAEEIASRAPEESGHLQMTDARCKRCMEKQVGLTDIIQTGLGDRYQLECVACGNTWYASRDDAATLTIEGRTSSKTVGTAPLPTVVKFEDPDKSLASPRDNLKKTTEECIPVLDNQKSFNKTEENPVEANAI